MVRIQFVAFEKFKSAYLHQIAREIMLLLVNNFYEKRITDSQDRRNSGKQALFIIYPRATSVTSANQTRVVF